MKVCFIGSGSIGKRHIRNFVTICQEQNISYEIHLLRATHRALPEDIRGMVSKEMYHIEDLDQQYDAIFIANPTYLHYDTILQTANKSTCFFVEKPLFDTLSHDPATMGLPAKNTYYIACPLRYTKTLQYAKRFLQNHSPISVRAISSSYLPQWRPGVDYRETYSAHREQGGGVGIDLIHEWDYLSCLFGLPQKVYKFSGKFSDLEIDSDDLAVYIGQYKNFLLELHLDYFGKETQRYLEVFSNEGRFTFDICKAAVYKDGEIIEQFDESANDKYLEEMRSFFSVLHSGVSANDMIHAWTVQKITS